MTKEFESFSKYGRSFQEGLVQIILDDRAFADQIGEVLVQNWEQFYAQTEL